MKIADVLHTKNNLFVIKMRFSSSIYHNNKKYVNVKGIFFNAFPLNML